jgi:hypothetical protein
MIQKLPSYLDLKELNEQVNKLEYWLDGAQVQMCVTQSGGLPSEVLQHRMVAFAIEEITRHRQLDPVNVMINKVGPEVIVPVHRDWLKPTKLQPVKPVIERWHLPIVTNEGATFWGELYGVMHMACGCWYGPIPYWRKHTVANCGTETRIHLIVDLDCHEPLGKYEEDE